MKIDKLGIHYRLQNFQYSVTKEQISGTKTKIQDFEPNINFCIEHVRLAIRDYLWDDQTGLPLELYTESDVMNKSEEVYQHIFRAYPTLPSPLYAEAG